jgi:hypothetical protein
MSTNSEAADEVRCAACGIEEKDDTKLKKCATCDLVRFFCSVIRQKDHMPKNKRDCKKRVAELSDEILFKQPESTHWGDCPICCLPLPIDQTKFTIMACCSKIVCDGCEYANQMREWENSLDPTCPFCRELSPSTMEEVELKHMKRINANDPNSLSHKGTMRSIEGDYDGAFEYMLKAAGLGNCEAQYRLSIMYDEGKGVKKDAEKELHHLEQAAIGGHPGARYSLACIEFKNRRPDRAVKHWTIAANLGHDDSTKRLKDMYAIGIVSKVDFAAALRAHQAAVDATKSPQREAAEAFRQQEKFEAAKAGR